MYRESHFGEFPGEKIRMKDPTECQKDTEKES